jgi:hypothetical protein
VTRLKAPAVLLLLALWVPQASLVLGLMVVVHGTHHVSLQDTRGALAVVLHHHDVAHLGAPVIDVDDHRHGDHVIHGGEDGLPRAKPGAVATPHVCVLRGVASGGSSAGLAFPPTAPLGLGPAPPLRSVVLRI